MPLPLLLLAGGAGMGFLQGRSAANEADSKWRIAQEQIEANKKQRGQLQEVYGLQLGMASESLEQQTTELSYGAGQSLYDITTQGQQGEKKSGLVYGSSQKSTEELRGKARKGWGFGMEKAVDVYGQKILDIESGYQGEVGRLDSELTKLNYESRMYQNQMSPMAMFTNMFSGAMSQAGTAAGMSGG